MKAGVARKLVQASVAKALMTKVKMQAVVVVMITLVMMSLISQKKQRDSESQEPPPMPVSKASSAVKAQSVAGDGGVELLVRAHPFVLLRQWAKT